MKGITFIRILDESISPVAAVKAIFKKIKSSGMLSTRFAARIIPIERTCYAHLEDVIAIVSEEIKKTFTEETAGKTVATAVDLHLVVLQHQATQQQHIRPRGVDQRDYSPHRYHSKPRVSARRRHLHSRGCGQGCVWRFGDYRVEGVE